MKLGRRGFLLGTTAIVTASSPAARILAAPAPALAMGELGTFGGLTFGCSPGQRALLSIEKLLELRRILDAAPVPDRQWIPIHSSQLEELMREPTAEERARWALEDLFEEEE